MGGGYAALRMLYISVKKAMVCLLSLITIKI
jgi:hypothetical protein